MPTSTDLFYYCCCGEGDVQARQDKLKRIDLMTTELRTLRQEALKAAQAGNSKLSQLLNTQVEELQEKLVQEEESMSPALMCTIFMCIFVCVSAIASTFYILLQ